VSEFSTAATVRTGIPELRKTSITCLLLYTVCLNIIKTLKLCFFKRNLPSLILFLNSMLNYELNLYRSFLLICHRNSGKKSATDQKRWQISKNDLGRFDSQFSIESKNEIKLGRFHLKKTEL
jgi:hypothetical protein